MSTPMFSAGAPPMRTVTVIVDGVPVAVPEDFTVAAALLMIEQRRPWRRSAVSGAPRAPYCLMGVCFECVAEIDGQPNRQSCMVTVQPGMTIRRQHGKRAVAAE